LEEINTKIQEVEGPQEREMKHTAPHTEDSTDYALHHLEILLCDIALISTQSMSTQQKIAFGHRKNQGDAQLLEEE
jgi:hypothetical protein